MRLHHSLGVVGISIVVALGCLSLGGCPSNGTPDSSNQQYLDTTGGDTSTNTVRPPNANNNGSVGNGTSNGTSNGNNTNANTGTDPVEPVGLPVVADDHVLAVGNPPLTVVEYADFQCPNCGRFARNTFPTIKQNFIDTGKVRWVTRHYPLTTIHASAQAAAEASECAASQGKFEEYITVLFNNQDALSSQDLIFYADQLGLNIATFQPCVQNRESEARVNRDALQARELAIPGTPGFFIGEDLVTGFKSVDDFSALLNAKLTEIGAQ